LRQIDYWSSDISSLERVSIISILGVRYLVSPRGDPAPGRAGFLLIHSSDADVWENTRALPRAFIATKPIMVENAEAALDAVSAPEFPFDRTAVVTMSAGEVSSPAGWDGRSGTLLPAHLQRYEAENIEITAHAPEGGWLVLSDLYYPGWEATIDGNPTEIFPGNFIFRAVRLPPGSHNISFTYRPKSFRLGLVIALISCLAIIAILLNRNSLAVRTGS